MSPLNNQVLSSVLTLEIRLHACVARLRAHTDDEALHDLRIALRTLRSILRPLRGSEVAVGLEQAAAVIGRLSGPIRDAQVLLAELQRLGQRHGLTARFAAVQQGIEQLLVSAELAALFTQLAGFANGWRFAIRMGELSKLRSRVAKGLQADRQRLLAMLSDPQLDWHQLRVKVKRLRYSDENYPRLSGLSRLERKLLRQLQSALGDWHDRWQWLVQVEQDPDLADYKLGWQAQLVAAEPLGEQYLQQLQGVARRSDL